MRHDDTVVRRLLIRTGLNEYELAVKLVQLVHLDAVHGLLPFITYL